MNNRPVLEAVDLKVAYGGNVALDLPRIAVRERELVGVVGANGAGKSTLVKIVSGVHPPSAGAMELDGRPIAFRNASAARDH